ncbi:MAG: 50S ribosomal protein L20 [Patescibacteria group bacterium]
MSRVKKGLSAHKHHKYTLQRTKGYTGGRKSKFRLAKEALLHADSYAYRDRRNKKRDFRSLWIVRLNNSVQLAAGMSYSKFMGAIKGKTELNRKMLSEMAIADFDAFKDMVSQLVK